MRNTYHSSVMAGEIESYMRSMERPSVFIDATLGEGGHSLHILNAFPHIFCIGIDADEHILERAKQRLEGFANRIEFHNMWFDDFFCDQKSIKNVSGILFDLGISTFHYGARERGFSFDSDDAIDMRISQKQERSAEDILYETSEQELADIFYYFGEESRARKIARSIYKELIEPGVTPITCERLAYTVKGCFPKERRYKFPHPATRVFQALRIAVNSELDRLKRVLHSALLSLEHLGLLMVISFHSLEDRIVKNFFKSYDVQKSIGTDSEEKPLLRIVTKKVQRATLEEVEKNPSSRSAKLRVAQRIVHA